MGSTGTLFTYENLTAGLAAHILRRWGFAMAYYILVRRVTLLSAFAFPWVMTVIYWMVFPIWVLNRCSPTLDMVVHGLDVSYGLCPRALGGTKNPRIL